MGYPMRYIKIDSLPDEPGVHNPEISKKTICREDDLPNIINFGLVTYKPGQIVDAHSHENFYEVFYFNSGKGVIRVNGMEYSIQPDVCILLEPNDIHEMINSGDEDLQHLFFQVRI